MPNWCAGNIRVRGTFENIVRLFKENLSAIKVCWDNDIPKTVELPPKVTVDDWCVTISNDEHDDLYIKGTHRNFIGGRVEICDNSGDDGKEFVFVQDGYRAAWGIDINTTNKAFRDMAQKYGVDIKLYGFEQGMEFAETAEYYRNGTEKHETQKWDDWDWDCPCPNMGG